MTPEQKEALTRPIIGIENRTALEVFDIMSDRIRALAASQPAPAAHEFDDPFTDEELALMDRAWTRHEAGKPTFDADRLADKVEGILAEFGHTAEAAGIVGEYMGEWRHARPDCETLKAHRAETVPAADTRQAVAYHEAWEQGRLVGRAAALVDAHPAPLEDDVDLGSLMMSLEGIDKDQPGYIHRKGWNAALLRVMDLKRATTHPAPLDAERLREAADTCAFWLEGALKCKNWHWDADQHEAATWSLNELRAALHQKEGGQ